MLAPAGEDETGDAFASAWHVRSAAFLLVLLGILAYSNAVTNHFIGIDTLQNVRDNPDIRTLTPLPRALSLHRAGADAPNDNSTLVRRPILSFSFALSYAVLGPQAWGFQVGNIAIHIAAALLLFGIVRRTFTIRASATAQRGCWLAFSIAAIWLVHPLNTESVTNIVQRAESLMGCFAFLTLYCAIRSWQSERAPRARGWSAASVLACALGMATKEVMVVVPVLVWLYDAIFLCGSFAVPLRRRWSFYLLLGATWAVPGLLMARTVHNTAREFDSSRIGAYVLSQPRVVLHYLRLAFWPHPLHHYIMGGPFLFHPGLDSWLALARSAVPVGILLVATLVAALRLSPAGFLGAAFFLPLLPTSIAGTLLIQEHRAYLSLAPLVTGTVMVLDAALVRSAARWRWAGAATAVPVILIALTLFGLVYGTRLRNQDYRSDLTLWAPHDLPLAFTMLSNLAVYHAHWSEAAEVLDTLLGASMRARRDEPLFAYRARALNGLGTVHALQTRLGDAQQLFAQTLVQDPSSAAGENNLGVVLFLRGDAQAARQHLQAARALDPLQAAARHNLEILSAVSGDSAESDSHLAPTDLSAVPAPVVDDGRRATAGEDLSRAQFMVALSPPDAEFTMDFTLTLWPVACASELTRSMTSAAANPH
jgi:hypothetical protein